MYCGILNFVHYHFGLRFFQEPRYLFMLVNLISCGASKSTNVLMVIIIMGQLVGLSPKTL